MPSRLFSQSEANSLVPTLQLSFATISEMRSGVEELLADLASGDPTRIAGILRGEEPVPPGEEPRIEKLQSLIVELGEAVESVVAQGVIIQELDPGMVDFPSLFDGRVVLLSWQYGEHAVEYFHELDDGFESRAPLPDAHPVLH
ncbi:hypothetical protein AKJ08_1373 [Vulgatibacter incomptus]|uniref:DUF2203 domain-containing protein n=1 Tax=Vulgatibacter incomptus TaxID=1391653 RepID=A0A0K1PC49_9BACT|nr:hypothetical protein AKJ08_1373 [Vulgatibacter incomptus]